MVEPVLILPDSSSGNKFKYISGIILKLMGIDKITKVINGDDTKLVFKDRLEISEEELTKLFNIITLEREREYSRDSHGRFDQSNINWSIINPEINEFADKLKKELNIGISPQKNENFKVIFTHDIDWVTGFEVMSFAKSIKDIGKKRKSWIPFGKDLEKDHLICIYKKICQIEKKYGIKTWNFLLSGPHGFGRYSSRYDSKSNQAQKMIQAIQENGNFIGLHGSYYSADNNSYKDELHRLQEASGEIITAQRNHYLRFNPEKLWDQLHYAGIKYDFSVGYSSHIGFRAGIANSYIPYDTIKQKPSEICEIPLVYMDRSAHIEDQERVYSEIIQVVSKVKQYNGCVSVLFHPESFAIDDKWFSFYERVIEGVVNFGADVSGKLPVN